MTNRVSIVIPTLNGGPLFRELLIRLKEQEFDGQLEIVVVDSGSTDGTVELAREYGATVEVIPPGTFNHGLTRDHGVRISTGDIIVLMTQDAIPGDNSLIANLYAPFEDPQVAGSYARQIPRADADIFTKRTLNNWVTGQLTPEVRWIRDVEEYNALSPMGKYLFCNFDNVCSAIRRSVWELFPFQYNDFGEDIAWSKRVLESGWKIAYQPSACVVHSHGRSIRYEYKRTYVCLRTLYRLFGLITVPSLQACIYVTYYAIRGDILYLLANRRFGNKIFYHLLRIPFLAIAANWAQYRGFCDEKNNKRSKVRGV
jgi:rhamnosyltransferase